MQEDISVKTLCYEEYLAYKLYSTLAKNPLLSKRYKEILKTASREERKHYEFWKKISGECADRISGLVVLAYALLLWFFGITVIFKLVEKMESSAIESYSNIIVKHPDLRNEIETIIKEEKTHETKFIEEISEGRVKYLSSIALGVSDALVELTGIYTGSLGAFSQTISAGLIGLIAGFSASISMAIASYSQAKHAGIEKPLKSSIYTMTAYLVVALLLALPYFILSSISLAFTSMLITALLIIGYMSFYSCVLHEKRFTREFLENAALLLGVSLALYLFGSVARRMIGFFLD